MLKCRFILLLLLLQFSTRLPLIVARFDCDNQSSVVSFVGTNSGLILNNSLTGFSGTLNIKDNVSTTITGTSIFMTGGILNTNTVSTVVSGVIDPTSTDTIILYNGNYLDVKSGQIVQAVTVASSSTATILGQPRFSSSIILTDTSSILQLGITTELKQPLTGTGTVKLLNDLSLGASITLPSLVNLNNYNLLMQGGSYSNTMTVTGNGIIELLGSLTLTGSWTIGAGAENYTIAGHGNVLDLSSTGTLVFNGSTLTLENLVIKGLTTNLLRGLGEIKLTNVTLDLASNYTRSDGKLTVFGSNCKIITNGYNFVQSGSGNDLKIDGVTLFYEQLNSTIQSTPISVASSAAITYLNGGQIMSIGGATSAGVGGTPTSITSAAVTLDRNYCITSAGIFTINNPNTANPYSVSLNGSGQYLAMPQYSGSFLILQNNVNLNLNNIVLKDFNPAAILLGTSASITFGDNTRLELGADQTIGASDMTWTFTGNATIDGKGTTLTVNKSGGITITGTKTLTLKNMTLVAGTADCIKCLTDNDHIKLQDVIFVVQSTGYSFSTGYLDIANFTKITGSAGMILDRVNFEFASKGYFTIGTNAELFINQNINLKYNANPANDTTTYASKRHLLFSQITSQLTLNGSSLECTATGLAIDSGTIKILDKAAVISTTTTGAELEIGGLLQINITAGAAIDLNGPVIYTETKPPSILKYGDGFALKHKTYGFYASTNGDDTYNSCFGTQTLSNATRFVIQPFLIQTNNQVFTWGDGFGGSLLLTQIKSGDIIVFCDYGGYYTGFEFNGGFQIPPVSSPTPPYFQTNSNSAGCSRIFKKGGNVGDPIFSTDDIYIIHLWGWSNGDKSPGFLGSSNLTWTTNKEIFWYFQASGFPPNFSTNYLWNFDQYQAAAYTGIPNYATNHVYLNNGGWYSYWSPYFVAGGAKYINPTTLQV